MRGSQAARGPSLTTNLDLVHCVNSVKCLTLFICHLILARLPFCRLQARLPFCYNTLDLAQLREQSQVPTPGEFEDLLYRVGQGPQGRCSPPPPPCTTLLCLPLASPSPQRERAGSAQAEHSAGGCTRPVHAPRQRRALRLALPSSACLWPLRLPQRKRAACTALCWPTPWAAGLPSNPPLGRALPRYWVVSTTLMHTPCIALVVVVAQGASCGLSCSTLPRTR